MSRRPILRGAAARAARAQAKANPAAPPLPPSVESMRWVHDYLASGAGSGRDRALLLGYSSGARTALSHTDHVRLGWLFLRQNGPGIAAFRLSQQAWIAATRRTAGYHETLTRAYLLIIETRADTDVTARHVSQSRWTGDSLDFVERWPDLLTHVALDALYGPGAFAALRDDERARREWVSPEEWRSKR